jgi:hypothetical protein
MLGSVCGSALSSSISALLGFGPTPVMRSTKCKSFTCRLTDGMSIASVSGVRVLISWHVGHGFFVSLQDLCHILGGDMYCTWPCVVFGRLSIRSGCCLCCFRLRERYLKIGWYLWSPSDLILCEPLGDDILFVVLVPNVLRGLLLVIAPCSIVLP